MRILLADGDQTRLASFEVMLGQNGFNVYSTDDAEELVDLARLYDYDLILLGDVTFAQRVLQHIRAAKCKTPILRLSSLASSLDIVSALNAGADDYMPLPADEDFHKDELIARIHAVTRRSRGHAASLLQVGTLTVNMDTKTVHVAGQRVHLTGKEYAMLELMALRKGSLITKEMFLNHLYGGMDEPEIKIIDVFICKVRKKLGPGIIETVWGRGYVLASEVEQDLASEVRDMVDDPPTGFVPDRTFADHRADAKAAGRIKSPSLVPALGQK